MNERGRCQPRHAQSAPAAALLLLFWVGAAGCGDAKNAGADAEAVSDGVGADAAVDGSADVKISDGGGADGDTVGGGDGAAEAGDALPEVQTACPGGENCPCKVNGDCDNNVCLEVPDGHRCGISCGGGSCPGEATCTPITPSGTTDILYFCVAKWGRICEPCDSSKLCSAALGNEKGQCVAYGGVEGSFCGAACGGDGDCPSGFACKEALSVEGKTSQQCVRKPDGLGHIQCPCDANASAQKLATLCASAVVTGGNCPGVRVCGAGGLSACTATPAAGESCDGVDNDCNGLTDDVVCDDKNVCTEDLCAASASDWACGHNPNALVCSDGNACTGGDVCAGGVCGGKTIDCDDSNACTTDSCDKKVGCQHEDAAIPCSDGDACTLSDTCVAGECVSGKKKDCDDKKTCTADSCDTATAECSHVSLEGNKCNDGDLCTENDLCAGGKCGGSPVNCDDNNPCTLDACQVASGCEWTPAANTCDDGNLCTVGDKCANGVCISGTSKECGDQNGCTADSCDIQSGACVNKALNGAGCNDNDACTEPDTCTQDTCSGKGKSCDDSNSCTNDTCDSKTGCAHTVVAGACEDGNPCTVGDTCANDYCFPGNNKNCDDNNTCTGDLCVALSGDCTHIALTNVPCNDFNACTGGDKCGGGGAGPLGCGGNGLTCDDGNPCTDDSCDVAKGCINAGTSKPCNDKNECTTGDTCFGPGICFGSGINVAVVCDDGNPCTLETCDPIAGCKYTPKAAGCDDGNPCTQNDTCDTAGSCVPGTNVCGCNSDIDCAASEDGDLCNGTLYCDKSSAPFYCKVDQKTVVTCDKSKDGQCKLTACDPGAGQCVTTNFNDGKTCNADASVCTPVDKCLAGVCKADAAQNCNDANPCTDDSCDPKNGCVNSANVATCDDGNACTIGDVCNGTVCLSGAATICDDGNGCTANSCDKASGDCVFNGAPYENTICSDNSLCTNGDTCKGGVCTAGPPLACPNSNPCIDASCDPAAGCKSSFNAASCSDGDLCSTGDACQSGNCIGVKTTCNDGKTCTNDSCDPNTGGCVFDGAPNEGTGCDDKNGCTLSGGDICQNGACVGTTPKSCDDNKPCTNDSCDPGTGNCVNTNIANATLCNDGNACTFGDSCLVGTCVGQTVVCEDNNPCTTNQCDSVGGCSYPDVGLLATPTGCSGSKWCINKNCLQKGCGTDGYVDTSAGEQCDDGNLIGCDGCEGCQNRFGIQFSGAVNGSSGFGAPSGATPLLGIDGDLTIEVWVNPANLADVQPIVAYAGSFNTVQTYYLGLEKTTGLPVFQHQISTSVGVETKKGTIAVAANVWSHLAVVVAGQQVRFFVNGVPAGIATLNKKRMNAATAALVVGRLTPEVSDKGWIGSLDELHIAAAPLYGGGFTPPRRVVMTAATRALWHFDEGGGTSAGDTSGSAQKPAYNLALTEAVWQVDGCYGAAKNAGVCGDGVKAAVNGSFPAIEECDDGNANVCGNCQDCRSRKQLAFGGTTGVLTPSFASWAADAFCPTCQTTIEAWAKLDVTQSGVYSTLFSVTCNGLFVVVADGQISAIRLGANGLAPAANIISVGSWHHYAIELGWANYAPLRLYVDGSLALDIKPGQWDPGGANVGSLFGQEKLQLGAIAADPNTYAGECVQNGDKIDAVFPWTGEMDEVRVSAGLRYGGNFVPARRLLPDTTTRGLWHLDNSGIALVDDSSQNVATTNSNLSTNDDCYKAATSSSKCGDGGLAPWEWNDGSTKAGNFPSSIASVGLTCGPYWNADCTGFGWLDTDPAPPALTNAVITYPLLAPPGGSATLPGPWTWEGWVRLPALPASGKVGTILAMDSSATGGGCGQSAAQAWAIQTTADGTDASTLGPGTNNSTARLTWKAGVWQHFALEYHGDMTGSLWVDGQKARDFNVTAASWSATCKMHIGGREGGIAVSNRISGQLASLHFTKFVKYGATFDPPWSLATDAVNTVIFWDFASTAATTCNSTDTCAKGVAGNGGFVTNGYIDIGSSSNWLASGPYCAQ